LFFHSSLKKERKKERKKEGMKERRKYENNEPLQTSQITGAVKGGQVQREKYEKHQRCAWVITYY
jgi:hypothetical protein